MTVGWASSAGPLSAVHDVLLLDLDGVVYVGPNVVPHAAQVLINAHRQGTGLAYITNNAARTPQDVATHLRSLGLPAEPVDVVTSAQVAASMLSAELPAGAAVLVVGGEGLRCALMEVGLRPVSTMEQEPAAVVQGFSPQTDWAMLAQACVAVRAGLPWVATNPDLTVPTVDGLAPGNGAFVDVVRRTTGGYPRYAGKPHRAIVDQAVARTGAAHPLVVGDRLDTDLAVARAAGLAGLLVLTGVSAVRDLLAAGPQERPSYLAGDLRGLSEQHRAPVRQSSSWCGGKYPQVVARWRKTGEHAVLNLTVSSDSASGAVAPTTDAELALEIIRVACAAVWDSTDEGGDPLDLAQVCQELSPWSARQGWDR